MRTLIPLLLPLGLFFALPATPAAAGTPEAAPPTVPAQVETVEGVTFTSAEVAAVLWGVNRADIDTLDLDVGLDRRAAENLTSSGPYESLTELAAVDWVGPSALRRLRAYAPSWRAVMELHDALARAGH